MTVFGFRRNLFSLEIALAIEVAAWDINELQKKSPTTATVQRLQVQTSKLSSCHRSGNIHHESPCRFRQVECRNCGKLKLAILQRFVRVKKGIKEDLIKSSYTF